VEEVNARSVFSPATGYIKRAGFDWTCNPYVGCSFGCSYCYAMFLPQNRRPKAVWGKWLQAKVNAIDLARRDAGRVAQQALYISSVTDPYLPIEKRLGLTRGILEVLLPHQPRLAIQTRGALVVRDLDLLGSFKAVRINISIPTDSEAIRKVFEPKAPTLESRWQAAHLIRQAGLPIALCLTPLLPIEHPAAFRKRLAAFAPDLIVTEFFHDNKGGFGGSTGEYARLLLEQMKWTRDHYDQWVRDIRKDCHVLEGVTGFYPPGAALVCGYRANAVAK
jgi:DNA repair photolyase